MNHVLLAALVIAGSAAPASAAPSDAGLIGIPRAVAIAERHIQGRATDADLEREKGQTYYEVEVARGGKPYEVRIDARTGRVLATVQPGLWSGWFGDSELRHIGDARPLSAILSDLERRSGGRVTEVSFDVERGQPRYEIEIATRAGVAELHVDPRTGNRLAQVYDD